MTFNNKAECSIDPYLSNACLTTGVGCISWTAVLTGALVSVGLSFLLNLFTVAIGLTAFVAKDDGAATLAIGGFIAILIGVIAIMFFSGFISGYLARKCCAYKEIGALYGFLSWVVALIIVILIASGFTHFVASYYHTLFGPEYSAKSARTLTYPLLSTEQKQNQGQAATRDRDSDKSSPAIENIPGDSKQEKAENILLTSLFATFLLFFIGAAASALGGYFGLACGSCNEKYGTNNDMPAPKVRSKDI